MVGKAGDVLPAAYLVVIWYIYIYTHMVTHGLQWLRVYGTTGITLVPEQGDDLQQVSRSILPAD